MTDPTPTGKLSTVVPGLAILPRPFLVQFRTGIISDHHWGGNAVLVIQIVSTSAT